MVPLSVVVQSNRTSGPQPSLHYQQLVAGISLGRAVEKLNDLAQKILPSGVNCELQGEAKQFILSMRNLAVFIIVIMFLIYVVF